jgi:Zn-dependent protease
MFSDLSAFGIVVVLVSIIISMGVHEAMHGFVAHWLGDDTAEREGRLTLNPLKHIDIVTTVLLPMVLILLHLPPIFAAKPVPFNPERVKYEEYGVALIGLAGPLTNLVLAAVAGLVFQSWGLHQGENVITALVLFVQVNIAFFVFNMIPFPPLDGSRLLYAFAPEPIRNIMEQIESYGFMAILVFFFLIFQFIADPIINLQNQLALFFLGLS